ncbi:hypothetical protein B0F90DRAFT_953129 [Multifurca ochricompacta]|uniref:Uncharacterized protein n=1 Tax=Multifurca ochricompacta TaxID=376703 RepID=A0AAD4M9Z0_9AGAM|nr:hypothetical protein B0F90DRAFT_953129 [Multifurca ochricompacta]
MSPHRLSRQPSPHRSIKLGPDSGSHTDQADELEDRMDWMGDRLAELIKDGKKALGKEVVVMSEAQEDGEDDGNGNWEEEVDRGTSLGPASRSGSIRRKGRPQAMAAASNASAFYLPPLSASPRSQRFSIAHPLILPQRSPSRFIPPTMTRLTLRGHIPASARTNLNGKVLNSGRVWNAQGLLIFGMANNKMIQFIFGFGIILDVRGTTKRRFDCFTNC